MEWVGNFELENQMATHSVALVDLPAVSASIHQESSSKPLLLEGYLRREELAQQLQVSPRTIDRWHTLRSGPPRVTIGRTILYSLDSVREWLKSSERSVDDCSTWKRRRSTLRG